MGLWAGAGLPQDCSGRKERRGGGGGLSVECMGSKWSPVVIFVLLGII